jgi:lipopolysaccharide transport system ATP-binding protein
LTAIEVRNTAGEKVGVVGAGQDVDLYFHFENRTGQPWPDLKVYLSIKNNFDISVVRQGNYFTGDDFGRALPARGALVCRLRKLPLPPGTYRMDYMVRSQAHGSIVIDQMDAAIDLHVEGGDYFGTGRLPTSHEGLCLADGSWRLVADAVAEPAASDSAVSGLQNSPESALEKVASAANGGRKS